MKGPIAHRPVTGARRILHRRGPRRGRGPLRRPLALLYRQSARAGPAAPASIRAADGRPVPLAPRFQIALHLSFMLNEQHRAFQVPAATLAAAPVRLAAMAAPAQRQDPPFRSLTFAQHSMRMDAGAPAPAGPTIGWPQSLEHSGARGHAGNPGRHLILACAGSGFRRISLSSGGRPGPASADAAPLRTLSTAAGNDAAAAGALGTRSLETFAKSGGAGSPRARDDTRGPIARSRILMRLPPAEPHRSEPPSRRTAPPNATNGTNGTALGSARTGRRSIPRRLPGLSRLASLARPEQGRPPRSVYRPSIVCAAPAGRAFRAPLHLAERHGGRTAAPASFGSDRAPPPLDFRSAAPPPPPPPPPAEMRAAATSAPSAATVDREAISRDVISRIEKRLRVERERRGRS